ncbi:MAG TPA: hypothetical protein VM680_04160 [Verrucomicrobiae bacterium]|nr:hypothetical protein [Verrucomicrobiae bacterium]
MRSGDAEMLSAEELRTVAVEKGIDFATTLLFERVRSRHAEFIASIDDLRRRVGDLKFDRDVTVGIVPAAFYVEKPHAGADGHVIRAATGRVGIRSELIPIKSVGTLAENSEIIIEWLHERAGSRIVLVSLCKGAADLKVAFEAPDAERAFANVQAWINVCGTPYGSPIAEWMLATKFRFFASWLYLKTTGRDIRFLREIVPSTTGPLSSPLKPPEHLRVINVVGFPLLEHLSNAFMRRSHRLIARHGPNDGGVLLAEACRAPGSIYPVWGADHYLRPDSVAQEIILAILAHLLETAGQRSSANIRREPCPAT